MTHEEYWYWLCSIENINVNVKKALLSVYSSPAEIYEADAEDLRIQAGLKSDVVNMISASKDPGRIAKDHDRLSKSGIRFISLGSEEFPERLRQLDDCPLCLYIKGKFPDEGDISIGMVGARACSGYGREFARKYAMRLAECRVRIVSGMATGIDSICAKGAMEAGGMTFAVLGSGIDVIYPRENTELYYEIIARGGGIISEYPPGTPPIGWQFPHRNRLIAGLSDLLMVFEAGKRSGTLSTAMHALDQGKDVWALPGRVDDRLSQGCNELIRDGAGILTDIEAFMEYYDIRRRSMHTEDGRPEEGLMSDKRKVYSALGYEPAKINSIAEKADISADKAVELLTELELEGMITRVSGAYYARK